MTAIRFNILAACAAVCALLIGGCAPQIPTVYYNYKSGETNFYAALSVCRGRATSAAPPLRREKIGENCTPNVWPDCPLNTYCPPTCTPVYASNAGERHNFIEANIESCLTELGWLPCSQGGQGRPECSCLLPGASGKPSCR